MARNKETPKPIFAVKHDFTESLEHFCQEAVMFHSAVSTIVDVGNLSEGPRKILDEACKRFRASMSSDD